MSSCRQTWILVVAACLAAACSGCGSDGQTPDKPGKTNGASGNNPAAKVAPTEAPPNGGHPAHPEDPPQAPTIPKVAMTKELLDTCLVRVGDVMPDAGLPGLDGKPQPLAGLRGQKLTVVCFWKSGATELGVQVALELLSDLRDLSEAYSQQGVGFVGINEGDPLEVVRRHVADAKASFPNLLDPDGSFFGKVATGRLPRVYLLDPEGKILWFDLEFSLTTRRSLKKGIQVALGEI